ncbi:hypothetical protein M2189_008034 [Bradyrhizobium japonicum]|uniref:hypothetical protein n=1 Tax=Bradyrhizobium japonicum TaxID=375 RepID=UPI002166F8B5|nr:hypothetical protein [Bradyrhizobium japonicum]MCS3502456.1 hypothetical protein [Bradyrhizobium japonicum]MCS3964831.1 hypothetical protein [Bradyrhizobium japonicum]MCS3997138.1 hypothetical protein [Bradyrhizobium japonicum]
MKRILIGLIVAAVLAAGGWFGFNLYAKHRATAEVETAFEQMRSGGGKASHGKITFELTTRTLTIENINVEPAQPELGNVKIAKVTAVGVRQPDQAHFAADGIEVSGVEVAFTYTERTKLKANYKIPQITARDFFGPTRAASAQLSGSIIDMYRFMLAQYATVSASSIVAPAITVNVDAGTGNPGSGDFVYSGLAVQNVNRGKIETAKTDRITFSLDVAQPGKPSKMTGELSGLAAYDFDASAVMAALDPQGSSDDGFHKIYRRISANSYTVTMAPGVRVQFDNFAIDDIAIRPSKFRLAEIMALMPADGSIPTPAQSRDMIEKVADFFEGFQIGKAEIGKQTVETPQGTGKLNAVKYDQDKISLEGLDLPMPQGQLKMERFALKSFSAANLMRWAASLRTPGQPPSPDQMLGLFRVLEGAEIKGVVSPYKNTRQLITIDTISLNWGQLVGSIPSKANLVVKMVTPTDPSNPAQRPLIMAGVDKLAIDLDLGAAWTESSGAFALAPATIDLGNLAKAQARFALANVPRGLFTTTDPMEAMSEMAQVETGAIELSLRDSGVVDLIVAQFSRMQNVSRDAARSAIAEMIRAQGEKVTAANLDAKAAVDALAGFVETSGQTLTIKLTPLGKVPVLQLVDALNSEPIVALAQFRIEASTGL